MNLANPGGGARPPDSRRLIIVSNRLPVTVTRANGKSALHDSPGGLATGLRGLHDAGKGAWVGWTGGGVNPRTAADSDLTAQLAARRLVPVNLTAQEVRQYYERFSNGVIWPLFHYLLDRVPLGSHEWPAYRAVNEKFAEAVLPHVARGDTVWVHDYQLLLLPALLRQGVSGIHIGFFLHIPFPSSELFRILPWRRQILEGLLGADLIGFHTHAYLRHFLIALRQVLSLEPSEDRVEYEGRQVQLGDYPMGVDAEAFARMASDQEAAAKIAAIRGEAGGRRILLGIDRLDYTKGIPRRLLAFERFLESDPRLFDRVRLVQIAVPSRTGVEPYQQIRRQVEEIVGRVNGRFGTVATAPIHYLYQRFTPADLAAMYRAADVMVVTPLRDGMNLVAKEFVASRVDEDGVLLLSEFAGAASELTEALACNPYDIDGTAALFRHALQMEAAERRARMRALRERVSRDTVHRWAARVLSAIATAGPGITAAGTTTADELDLLASRLRQAPRLTLLLDYDGTLVPFAQLPDLARPDEELQHLLAALSGAMGGDVHIVSGRSRPTLEQWLGHLPVHLWAEHGAWHRAPDASSWIGCNEAPENWMQDVLAILESFRASTPGSLVEPKSRSAAWHYRMVDPGVGATRAKQLQRALTTALGQDTTQVIEGHKVVEIRRRGVDKGRVVRHLLDNEDATSLLVAIGDDRTDEDMFAALPKDAITVRVGSGPSVASYRLPGSAAVRALLRMLVA